MKRDMDLARQILFTIEESSYDGAPMDIHLDGFSEKEVSYHVMLLAEAELVEAKSWSEFGGGWDCQPTRLTWQGHEFLDAARNENRWNQAKKVIRDKGGALTFDILGGVLTQLMRQAVGL